MIEIYSIMTSVILIDLYLVVIFSLKCDIFHVIYILTSHFLKFICFKKHW